MPVIDYEGDDFYFRTLTAGYYLWKDQENQLSIMGYYTPWGYRPGDSDDDRMKRLDKRRGTLMAGSGLLAQRRVGHSPHHLHRRHAEQQQRPGGRCDLPVQV